MNAISISSTKPAARSIRTILPVILRVTLSLALWTLGAIIVPPAEAQTGKHKAVQELPVDRARVENLQRWVNSGHDTWCRDAKFVAMMTLREASPEFSRDEYTLTSLSESTEQVSPTQAVYTMHSLDGHTTYRVTLRRYGWQKKSAGSIENAIWIPVRTEIITHDTLD
jgi:hypothetical protein